MTSFMDETLLIRYTNHNSNPVWMGKECQSAKMYYKIEIIAKVNLPGQYVEREYLKFTEAYFSNYPPTLQQTLFNSSHSKFQVLSFSPNILVNTQSWEKETSITFADGIYSARVTNQEDL